MPQVDGRLASRPYTTVFLAMHNKSVDRDAAVTGGSYNSVASCNVKDGSYRIWSAGPDITLHEVAFVPRTPTGKFSLKSMDRLVISLIHSCSSSGSRWLAHHVC